MYLITRGQNEGSSCMTLIDQGLIDTNVCADLQPDALRRSAILPGSTITVPQFHEADGAELNVVWFRELFSTGEGNSHEVPAVDVTRQVFFAAIYEM